MMSNITTQIDVPGLMADLASPQRQTRQPARETLTALGSPAVAPLLDALVSPNYYARWEAAKALGDIGDPAAAKSLVMRLEDERLEVRWRAAESLVALKKAGLAALLQALIHHSNSVRLREGAHHVLRGLICTTNLREVAAPVLAALEDVEPVVETAVAAHAALKELEGL